MAEHVSRLWLIIGVLLSLSIQAGEGNLYRYINDKGIVAIGYQVPAEYIGQGYEVLNRQGKVIKVVPPHATAQEQQAMEEATIEQQRQSERDKYLLSSYSTVAEIEAARDRSMNEIEGRLAILRSNQRSYRRQVETYQAQAADQERGGKSADVELLTAIEDLQDEIAGAERAIAEREMEIEEISVAYEKDIVRFRELEPMVERRRVLSALKD
jgi:hypothetical protein